jgi:hypothetical protein
MSQWVAFSRLRVPFHLYVPIGCIDSARRLCTDLDLSVEEMWAYHSIGDQLRFTLVHRTSSHAGGTSRGAAEPAEAPRARAAAPERRTGLHASRSSAARPARRATTATSARRPPPAKIKAAAPRRAVKTAARKSASAPSRAQKRR